MKVRNGKTHVLLPSCSCWEMKISEAVSQEAIPSKNMQMSEGNLSI